MPRSRRFIAAAGTSPSKPIGSGGASGERPPERRDGAGATVSTASPGRGEETRHTNPNDGQYRPVLSTQALDATLQAVDFALGAALTNTRTTESYTPTPDSHRRAAILQQAKTALEAARTPLPSTRAPAEIRTKD